MPSKRSRAEIYPVFIPNGGCHHQCIFCDQNLTASAAGLPSGEQVKRFLDDVLPDVGQGEVAFYGGTFTALPAVLLTTYLEVAHDFVARGRVGSVRISTRPDELQSATLETLSAYGVRTIEIGCQSFSDHVLEASERGYTAAVTRDALKRCKAAGYRVGVQLMPGLPGGDSQEALSSLQQALSLAPVFIRIYPTVVVAGTVLADQWRTGLYQAWTLDEAVECVADMMLHCYDVGVPVIRVGLHHVPEMVDSILAGPYHPSFGQLVRSRLWRRALVAAAEQGVETIKVHPSDLSDVYGHSRDNLKWLDTMDFKRSILTDSMVPRGFLSINDSVVPALPMLPGNGQ
jgi:histone acetyltransferase (RNA polymerase elongator complex component)